MNQAVLYVKIVVQVNVDNMEILIREFKEPTNIYICGCNFNNVKPDLITDDDEHSLYITDGHIVHEIYNYGEIFILTDRELKDNLENLFQNCIDSEIQYIHEYIGKITLNSLKIIDGVNSIDEFSEKLDLNDFICHQVEEYNEFCLKIDFGYSTNLWWKPFSANAIANLK